MGLYKSSIQKDDGSREEKQYYGYSAQQAGASHKADVEIEGGKVVAQKVTPAKD